MTRRPITSFFHGAELPRLLLLIGFALVGWLFVLGRRPPAAPAPPPPAAAKVPSLPPADPAPEFEGLQDRTPMNARDNAAYRFLLDRVREVLFERLHAEARRDVLFSQLFEAPSRYRGIPLHVEGIARRVLIQSVEGSNVFRDGRYYEAYVFTPDSMNNPYFLAFEQAPTNLSAGDDISQRVQFDGYFLKLVAYLAGDGKYRAAPLIVGRFPPAPTSATPAARTPAGRPASSRIDTPQLLLVAFSAYVLLRLALSLRRGRIGRTSARRRGPPITDRIEPAQLSAWLQKEEPSLAEDDEADRSWPPPCRPGETGG